MVTRSTTGLATTDVGATAVLPGEPTAVRTDSDQTPSRGHDASEQCRRALSAWQLRAVCAGLPQEIFYPPDGERGRRLWHREHVAKQICLSCPVLDPCRAHALDTAERHGVWGATTPMERRHLIQARIRARPSLMPVLGPVLPDEPGEPNRAR